jgi:hypothetical protein
MATPHRADRGRELRSARAATADERARAIEQQMTDDERFSMIISLMGANTAYPRDKRIPEDVKNMSPGYTPGRRVMASPRRPMATIASGLVVGAGRAPGATEPSVGFGGRLQGTPPGPIHRSPALGWPCVCGCALAAGRAGARRRLRHCV